MMHVGKRSYLFLIAGLWISESAYSTEYDGETIGDGSYLSLGNGDSIANSTVSSGGTLSLEGNSTSENLTLTGIYNSSRPDESEYGMEIVSGNSTASLTTINEGGKQEIYDDGTALNTTVNSGGSQDLYGGTALDTTINGSGVQRILSGGEATNTTVSDQGAQMINSGGVAQNTIVNGGSQWVFDGGMSVTTVLNDSPDISTQWIRPDGTAVDTTVGNNAIQIVEGLAMDTIINNGGTSEVWSTGTSSNTTVNTGGTLELQSGASAVDLTTIGTGASMLMEHGSSAEDIDSAGSIFIVNDPTGTADKTVSLNNFTNSGLLSIDASAVGTTVTVNGDYTGNDGHLHFNTVLGGDDSTTDKLVVTGNTSGNTGVSVSNIGGLGDQTLNGIELIEVGGLSEGTFSKEGRIVAGAYDYSLIRGTGNNANNWYLSSYVPTDPGRPIDPVLPMDPDIDLPLIPPPIDPDRPIDPLDPGRPVTPLVPIDPDNQLPLIPPRPGGEHVNRPEGGSYIANLAAANTLFNTRLRDRLGETQYVDALTGERKVTSLWLRQIGSHDSWRDSSGQLKTRSNSYVFQLGGEVARWSGNALDGGRLGLMAGYANSHSKTHSSVTGYDSKGSIDGYSVGAYATWFANDADKSGLYVDSWLLYGWFDNEVNGDQLASESYKSKGLSASLETGYALKMGEFMGSDWFIQPQAQAIWMGVKADTHREDNGTRVKSEGDGNLQARLGLRAYLQGHTVTNDGETRGYEPFIEANWLHNTRRYSARMDDARINQDGARNLAEIKLGVEGQMTPTLNLNGNIGTQVGEEGYYDISAMLGVKISF